MTISASATDELLVEQQDRILAGVCQVCLS